MLKLSCVCMYVCMYMNVLHFLKLFLFIIKKPYS